MVLMPGVKLSSRCAAPNALQSVELTLTSITHTRCSRHVRPLVHWHWNWGHSLIVHLNLRDDERQRSDFRTTQPASLSRTPFTTCDSAEQPRFGITGERRNRTRGEMRTQAGLSGYVGHLRASKTAKGRGWTKGTLAPAASAPPQPQIRTATANVCALSSLIHPWTRFLS
jgi:hypothetical protein